MSEELDAAALDEFLYMELFARDEEPRYPYPTSVPVSHKVKDGPIIPALSTTGDGMLMVLEALRGRNLLVHIYTETNIVEIHRGYGIDALAVNDPEDMHATSQERDSLPLAVAQTARAALEAAP